MQFQSISIELTNGEIYTYLSSENWKIEALANGFSASKCLDDSSCEMEFTFRDFKLWCYEFNPTYHEESTYHEECFGTVKKFTVEM